MVQCLWDEEYRFVNLPSKPNNTRPTKPSKLGKNSLQAHLYRKRKGNTPDSDDPSERRPDDKFDEYKAWCMDFNPTDCDVDDPFQYWINLELKYPYLSRMALDIFIV